MTRTEVPVICANCGLDLPDGAKYCLECGIAQTAPAPTAAPNLLFEKRFKTFYTRSMIVILSLFALALLALNIWFPVLDSNQFQWLAIIWGAIAFIGTVGAGVIIWGINRRSRAERQARERRLAQLEARIAKIEGGKS